MRKQIDIEQADPDLIEDSDGKPDFTEGVVYEQALKIATGAKYDSPRELIAARKQLSFWEKLKLTWQGKTRVGRIAGTALDVAELVLPAWAGRTRDLLQSKTNEDRTMKDILKRTFTTDGGSFIRVRDEDGKLSGVTIAVTIIRLALIVSLVYLADYLGLSVQELFAVISWS